MLTKLVISKDPESRNNHLNHLKSPLSLILSGSEENISIKQVRIFQKNIALSPTSPDILTHFILEAQNLTLPAQHALLKVLEEPPRQTQIILTADKTNSLLDTILSRCQVVHLQDPDSKFNPQQAKLLLSQIVSSNHSQLISLAKELSNSQDLIQSLTNLLVLLHKSLPTSPSINRSQATAAIQTCITDLNSNLNKQLVLEHCFFTLKSLQH